MNLSSQHERHNRNSDDHFFSKRRLNLGRTRPKPLGSGSGFQHGKVLMKSRLNRKEIFRIVDEEVAPALQANLLYNPTPVMDGWSEEDIKRLVTAYLKRKPTIIECIISSRLLLKQQRKHISKELNRLSAELDKGVIS